MGFLDWFIGYENEIETETEIKVSADNKIYWYSKTKQNKIKGKQKNVIPTEPIPISQKQLEGLP